MMSHGSYFFGDHSSSPTANTIPIRRPSRLFATKLDLTSQLKDMLRQHHDTDIDTLLSANNAVGNPDDQIVSGFHETPDEHSLDPVVSNSEHAYDLGWDDGQREGLHLFWQRKEARDTPQTPTTAHSNGWPDSIPTRGSTPALPACPPPSPELECGAHTTSWLPVDQHTINSRSSSHSIASSRSNSTSTSGSNSGSSTRNSSTHISASSRTSNTTSSAHNHAHASYLAHALHAAPMAAPAAHPHAPHALPLPLAGVARKPVPPAAPTTHAPSHAAPLKGSTARLLAVRDKTIRLLGPLPARREGEGGRETQRRGVDAVVMVFAVGVGLAWAVCVVGMVVLRRG